MVESAVAFPVVVLSVVSLIFMMIYFHTQLSQRVDMHIMLRAESGEICENLFYGTLTEGEYPVYREAQQIYSIGEASIGRKLLLYKHSKEIYARKYLVDESEFVRMINIKGEELTEND